MTGFPETHQTLVNLIGLQPQLPPVVLRALQLTTIAFSVYQGLRTPQQQQEDIAKGLSQTSHSRHLTGHAVDFYAVVNGTAEWNDQHPYCQIVLAFKQASIDLKTPIRWGGVWDRLVTDLSDDPMAELHAYAARQAEIGNAHAFEDIDHVELDRNTYP